MYIPLTFSLTSNSTLKAWQHGPEKLDLQLVLLSVFEDSPTEN